MKIPKIVQLPSGSWFCQIRIDGKSISITDEDRDTVEAKAYAYKAGILKMKKAPEKITLGEAMDRYIDDRSNILSPATVREYRRIRRTELAVVGDRNVGDITQDHLQKYINRISATSSPKTVSNKYSFIVAVIKNVIPDAHFNCMLPQKKKTKKPSPKEQDVIKLINYVKGKEIEIPILLAAFGSLRRSEICALTVDDLCDNGVYVGKAVVLNEHSKLVVKGTKTTESERIAHLPPEIVQYIRERCTGKLYKGAPNTITNRIGIIRKKLGLSSISLHRLRHYWATIAHALGLPDYYLMKNGGWTTMDTPRKIYLHDMSEIVTPQEQAVLDRFSEQFKKANC